MEVDEFPAGQLEGFAAGGVECVRTEVAQSIWLVVGVKTSCRVSSCRGWIADLPKKPNERANWACSRKP